MTDSESSTSVDLETDTDAFNIHLDEDGNLRFKANGIRGNGPTRMMIADDSGTVTVGGPDELGEPGRSGRLQLLDSEGAVTVDLRSDFGQLVLGGEDTDGDLACRNSDGDDTITLNGGTGGLTLGAEGTDGNLACRAGSGLTTIDLDGRLSRLRLFDSDGTSRTKRMDLDGVFGRLQLLDDGEVVTADLRGDAGVLTLGAAGHTDGDLFLLDSAGNVAIECNGETGTVECVTLAERPITGGLARSAATLTNALDRVLALRGVTCQREHGAGPTATVTGDARQIGFVCQELEAVCPELVTTDAGGRTSVNYSRMTAVLVEAVKEQQEQIRAQAAVLEAVLDRLGPPSVVDQERRRAPVTAADQRS